MKTFIIKFKWLFTITVVIIAIAGFYGYSILYSSNTTNSKDAVIVLIPQQIEWQKWLNSARNTAPIKNLESFKLIAGIKGFKNIKAGRYRFTPNMSNNEMINMLRIGKQYPLRIRIDDTTNLFELAGRLGKTLQLDSTEFINEFASTSKFSDVGFSGTTIACLIHPNTYDFFWTMKPQEFLEKMYSYHKKYFTEDKIKIAAEMGLNPQEVYILASIVKSETAKKEEAPKIAGLYLNRLRIDKPLQSDPTAVFAANLKHMDRVVGILETDSPYNTYQYKGLPPGPINFVEDIYLDAVLNPEKNDYIYMCAQPENTGFHNFSRTFDQHKENAIKYRSWLDQQGIR